MCVAACCHGLKESWFELVRRSTPRGPITPEHTAERELNFSSLYNRSVVDEMLSYAMLDVSSFV